MRSEKEICDELARWNALPFRTVAEAIEWALAGAVVTIPPVTIPPPMPPTDLRQVVEFQPGGVDDTLAFHAWLTNLPNNAVGDVLGVAAVNADGARIMGRTNVKVTSSTGGGVLVIGNGQ